MSESAREALAYAEAVEALDWLIQVHDTDASARRLAVVSAYLDSRETEVDRLIALADRLADLVSRVSAIVSPPCTCPGACSGLPRKVRAGDIRAVLAEETS